MKLAPLDLCTACMACIDSCVNGCLSFNISTDGYYEIVGNKDKCINCGICTSVCPVINKPQDISCLIPKESYAVWDQDENSRLKSSSGGAFVAIAKQVLQKGGVVYGASIDCFRIKHLRVDALENLSKLQGSKYQQSELLGIYKQVKKDLKLGLTVLFSGMSCQIAGLYSYLGKINKENLYTIDTICGGTSTILPMLQIEQNKEYLGIASFRDKTFGWKPKGFKYALKMTKRDGTIDNLGHENPVILSFCSQYLKRKSCMNCRFNGFNRLSDVTICDFWGIDNYSEQHEKGVSGLIVNNSRIIPFLRDSTLVLNKTHLKNILKHNPSYYSRFTFVDYRMRQKLLESLRQSRIDQFYFILKSKPNIIFRLLNIINQYTNKKRYYNLLEKK